MDITLIYHYLWFGDMGQKLLPNLNTQVNKLQIIARIISRKIDRSLFIIQQAERLKSRERRTKVDRLDGQ